MNKLLGLIGLMGLMGFLPIKPIMPINPIQAQDTNTVFLLIDGSAFFIDNEYFGDRVSGYTLPGFALQPKVEWRLHKTVTLKGGLHWLHYWGATEYPATPSYGVYPLFDSLSHSSHLLPYLQASVNFTPQLKFILGNLDDNDGHNLPLPLYNPELLLVGDPEAGFQIKYDASWINLDVWTDWNKFIWDRSPVPEFFTAGASGQLKIDHDNWILYLPLHFVAMHEGGQNMSVPHSVSNEFNGAFGLGYYKSILDKLWFDISCCALWYHQHDNAAVPFTNGWAFYPELQVAFNGNWLLKASYWHGKDFVPLLGSWHFSNLSANTDGLIFDLTRVITLHAKWQWIPPQPLNKNCSLSFYGTLYHYLPSIGIMSDGSTRNYGHRNQLAFGASLSFYPSLRLH